MSGRRASLLAAVLAALALTAHVADGQTGPEGVAAAMRPAQTAETECGMLVAELDAYMRGASVQASFVRDEPDPSKVARLVPGILTVTRPEVEGAETPQAFASAAGLSDCAKALKEGASAIPAMLVLNPPPTEEAMVLFDRAFVWGVVDGRIRWTIGRPLDIELGGPFEVRAEAGQTVKPVVPDPPVPDPPPPQPEPIIDLSWVSGLLWILPYLVALLSLLTLSRVVMLERRATEKAFATILRQNAAMADAYQHGEEGIVRLIRQIERHLIGLGRGIKLDPPSTSVPERVHEAPPLGVPPSGDEASGPGATAPPHMPFRAPQVDIQTVVRNYNELISVNGSADEFADAHSLRLFVGDRGPQELRPYDGQPGTQHPLFWIGLDQEEGAFALPGPDIVKSSTTPAVSREKLRGFFQAELGANQPIWVDKPAHLKSSGGGAFKVVSRGRVLLRH